MPAARNEAREAAVKALNKIARDVDIPGVSNNAGKQRVDGLLVSLRDYVTGNGATKCELEDAAAAYAQTWAPEGEAVAAAADTEAGDAEEHGNGAAQGRGYILQLMAHKFLHY